MSEFNITLFLQNQLINIINNFSKSTKTYNYKFSNLQNLTHFTIVKTQI